MAPATRSKRTLAEADPNVSIGAPAKKTTKKRVAENEAAPNSKDIVNGTRDKENEGRAGCGKGLVADEGAVVNAKGVLEGVSNTGKEKKKSNAGGKPDSAKVNSGAKKATAKASTSDGAKATKATSKASKATKSAPSYEWVTVCRPHFDMEKEDEERDGGDGDEEVDLKNDPRYTHFAQKTCKCGKPAAKSPGYAWVFTKAGYDQYLHWIDEQGKRDQDDFHMHIYSDFSGYGIVEVMENQFLDFNKATVKKNKPLLPLWSKLEGIAVWLNTDLFQWGTIEDPDRKNTRIVALYGTLLLSTISFLIKKNEFHPNSSIKNLGLIIGLFIAFATSSGAAFCEKGEEGEGNDGWTKRVVQLAGKHGVKIAGPWGIEKTIEEIEGQMDPDDEVSVDETGGLEGPLDPEDAKDLMLAYEEDWDDEEVDMEVRSWKTWNWRKEFLMFMLRNEGEIGGKAYDITKMPKRERAQYEFGRGRWSGW